VSELSDTDGSCAFIFTERYETPSSYPLSFWAEVVEKPVALKESVTKPFHLSES
jgi:hypothetical protein